MAKLQRPRTMPFHRLMLAAHCWYMSINRRMLAFMNAGCCLLVVKVFQGSDSQYPPVCVFQMLGLTYVLGAVYMWRASPTRKASRPKRAGFYWIVLCQFYYFRQLAASPPRRASPSPCKRHLRLVFTFNLLEWNLKERRSTSILCGRALLSIALCTMSYENGRRSLKAKCDARKGCWLTGVL